MEAKYLRKERLGDVITLIQILALNPNFLYRTSEKLTIALGRPKSEQTWQELAKEHNEFFRLNGDKNIVLLTRYAISHNQREQAALSIDETKMLIESAIDLYGKELTRESNNLQRKSVNGVLFAGVSSIVISIFSIWLTVKSQNGYDKILDGLHLIEKTGSGVAGRFYLIERDRDEPDPRYFTV